MWIASVLGQSARKLRDGALGFELSPDGAKIAFSPTGAPNDGAQKVVALRRHEELRGVHWAPDGQRLAFIRSKNAERSIETCKAGGAACAIAVRSELDARYDDLYWLPDGRLLYTRSESSGSTELWKVDVDSGAGTPTGKPSRISTWAGSNVGALSASLNGKGLAFLKQTEQGQIEIGQLAAGGTRLGGTRH